MSLLQLDHIVMACADLDQGADWLARRLGVTLSPGGRHAGFGTHNRLLQLCGGTYLELIAPDPSQGQVTRPRPFGLDQYCPKDPQLLHFVARCRDLDAVLPQLFYSPGPARTMTRDALRWKIATAADGRLAAGGVCPTLIEWPPGVHPCDQLPHQGIRLEALQVTADAGTAQSLAALFDDRRCRFVAAGQAWLGVELQTPLGRVFFNGPEAAASGA